jgi:DNA-binding transcriptional MerR regulator
MRSSNKALRYVKRHATLTAVSLTVGAPTLTVGQIAERLGTVAPDAGAERIRHWTREGLLLPVSQHHAGTGRHRHYSPETIYEAALLNAFANAGLQLVSRPYIQAALNQARAALQKWRQGHKRPLFLVISHDMTQINGEPTTSIHEGRVKHDPAAEIMIVVNLSQLFSGVRRT